ncbi:hypothetical protein QFZ27_004476 [Inquilinus ginsengisoli]|uniref:hypothetical protein n=1 Tax=Inquilinus ginsengisoli TaxID=363840 RepID=UPI003D23F60B
MAKVYREMRRDELSPETGSRFIFGLNVLRQAIEGADLERRLDELERKAGAPSSVTAGPWRKRA